MRAMLSFTGRSRSIVCRVFQSMFGRALLIVAWLAVVAAPARATSNHVVEARIDAQAVAAAAAEDAPVADEQVGAEAENAEPENAEAEERADAKPSEETVATPAAEPGCCQEKPKVCLPRSDEIWLVSTRGLGCPDTCGDKPELQVMKYDCEAHFWNASTLDALADSKDPAVPTVIWVHGNRVYQGEDRSQGLATYRQLTSGVSGEHPIRFVIFTWPSTPTRGLVEDARRKAVRTNTDGYYLAWLVNQMDPAVPVNFIGFSFGARIVTGGLHLLGGGTLMGRNLPGEVQPRAPMQAVLLAAAVNNNWLAENRPHGKAFEAVDRMLAMNNHCDRALKRYDRIDPCGCPVALGYTGAVGYLGPNGSKLRQLDVCCTIGKAHSWESYFCTGLVYRMRPYVGLGE